MNAQKTKLNKILLALFFVSGMSALVYEICWQKILALHIGSTAESLVVILSVYMAGLAVGSWHFGKLSDKGGCSAIFSSPANLFSMLMFSVGILGFVSPFIISNGNIYIASVYISIVTYLMGGTFPSVAKWFTRNLEIGYSAGMLYSANTFGAVAGSILSGYFLIYFFGIRGAIWTASAMDILVAIIAFILSRANLKNINENKKFESSNDYRLTNGIHELSNAYLILGAIAMSGLTSFVYEICWTRTLSMIIGSTTYAFTLMLASFLTGIAIGSIIYAKFLRRDRLSITFGFIEIGIGISALAFLSVFGFLPFVFLKSFKIFGSNFFIFSFSQFLLCFSAMIIPAILLGATLPLACQIYNDAIMSRQNEKKKNIGASVGNIYAANTIGCVFGAILTHIILVPVFGLWKSVIFATFLNVFVGLIFFLRARKAEKIGKYGKVLIASVLSFCYLFLAFKYFPVWDRDIVSSGVFRDIRIFSEMENIGKVLKKDKKVFYKEGKIFTVSVKDNILVGTRSLCIDGKPDASNDLRDMLTQVLLAHIPLILKPNAKTALIVGLASGITLGETQKYPLEKIVCCEIEPVMIEASGYFREWNNDCLKDKRTEIVIDDIRGYLRKTKKKFDVIISEPSNIWMRGEATLFAKEHFQIIKERLGKDGIFLQWVQIYKISPADYKMILRTLKTVFPNVSMWTSDEGDTLLLCSLKRVDLDLGQIKKSFHKAKKSLEPLGIKNYLDFLSCFIMEDKKLKEFAGKGKINTDNFPILEFSGAKSLYASFSNELWQEILRNFQSVNKYLIKQEGHLEMAFFYFTKRRFYPALQELNDYLRKKTPNAKFYNIAGMLYLGVNDIKQAEKFLKKGLKLKSDDLNILTNLAEVYQRKKDFKEAEKILKKILYLDAKDKVAYNNLGNLYFRWGKIKETISILEKGVKYHPKFPVLNLSLANAYLNDNKTREARKICEKLLKENNNYADAYFLLGEIYLKNNDLVKSQENFSLALKLKPDLIELVKVMEK